MGTKSGEMRETLIETIADVRSGKMKAADAKAIALLAQQVSLSLQVEANLARVGAFTDGMVVPKLGALPLGEETA